MAALLRALFGRGNFVLIELKDNKNIVVDSNLNSGSLKDVATTFFKETYNLK